jgi:hypothetical protein
MAEGNFGGQPGKAGSLDDPGSGKSQIFIDDYDLLQWPAQACCLGDQGVLSFR